MKALVHSTYWGKLLNLDIVDDDATFEVHGDLGYGKIGIQLHFLLINEFESTAAKEVRLQENQRRTKLYVYKESLHIIHYVGATGSTLARHR